MNKIVSFMGYPIETQRGWFDAVSAPEIDLSLIPKGSSTNEIIDKVKGAEIILMGPVAYLSREILRNMWGVKLIQFVSAGYDAVDLKAATELGIPVANNPGFPSIPVAEHTLMAMLVLMKHATYGHTELLKGNWVQDELDGKIRELPGKTVGILGLGSIGLKVAKRARAFGARIIYNKRSRLTDKMERELCLEYRTLDQVLEESDILTIHVPLTDETRNMIGRDEIAKMKRGAVLINTARGPIVDEVALAEALREGRLAGAAIDVPRGEGDGVTRARQLSANFEGIKNMLLTPHVASMSPEADARCIKGFTENVVRALRGEKPQFLVNDAWK
jgi:lactate dehydrogenase-like 2-hydroxyacid dehydrogenase